MHDYILAEQPLPPAILEKYNLWSRGIPDTSGPMDVKGRPMSHLVKLWLRVIPTNAPKMSWMTCYIKVKHFIEIKAQSVSR